MAKKETQVSDVKPPVATGTAAATKEAYVANNQVNPFATADEVVASEQKDADKKVAEHKEGAKEVDVKPSAAPEEKAAKRAGVTDERMTGAKIGEVKDNDGKVTDEGHTNFQNRTPKNQFEKENQAVTDKERQAAQKVSDMSVEDKEKKSEAPAEVAKKDAGNTADVNLGSQIADAIRNGNEKNFKIEADPGVEHRFSVVKDSDGVVYTRENETGKLSPIQLHSLEEKEALDQTKEVEEV